MLILQLLVAEFAEWRWRNIPIDCKLLAASN